ncbi:MAG TPA: hypothetical protein VEW28_05385 [Candidatus Kapabacteria bacterium]|nr:hypothetical protein [Candidatus Kapabacteria bacterium]
MDNILPKELVKATTGIVIMLFALVFVPCSVLSAKKVIHSHKYGTLSDTTHLEIDTAKQVRSLTIKRMLGAGMSGGVLLSDQMSQEGSGTSWQPFSSPTYALMYHGEDWMTMIHGHISPRYTIQEGRRGARDFDAPNYIMGMAQRMLGENTQLMFRSMLSFDRFTEGGMGYPLLLQTGETWQGKRLVDFQHPHDLFSELSVSLSSQFSEMLSSYVYIAYPGEPSIGPPAFMHRLSAMSLPDAPITHHWQDATHISFGVLTSGIACGPVKLEGSLFTGRDPDENRLNFDKPLMDSYSGRVSYNPTEEFAFQFSRAFMKNPEGDFSNEWLSSASGIYTHVFGNEEWISNTFVWSSKKDHHSMEEQTSILLESELRLHMYTIYSRFEYVEKPQSEMGFGFQPLEKEPLKEITIGGSRRLFTFEHIDIELGVQGMLNIIPENIAFIYGSENPKGFEVFLSLHPALYRPGTM